MDARCPRKLKDYPETYCPMAVMRLKALRNANRELTEAEEAVLPGCPWAVNHQMSNYCFFQFADEYMTQSLSDMEVAHLNNISVQTIKKVEKTALEKIRKTDVMKELKDVHGDDNVMEDLSKDETYKIR